ncbi:hypothetical protein Ancab_035542, partial [Ancistrocladus abbreviatus]
STTAPSSFRSCDQINTTISLSMSSFPRRRNAVVAAFISAILLVAAVSQYEHGLTRVISLGVEDAVVAPHRKLLRSSKKVDEPMRIWDTAKCSEADLMVTQGPTAPLPSGIPTYTVVITNACVSGCDISNIHFHCGWFSSARLINPNIFRRLSFDDCLINNGRPLKNGNSLTFQYANTFSYPLSISNMKCS